MKVVRIFSGDDGESHFEDLTIDRLSELVSRTGDGPTTMSRRPAQSFSDYHNAPRRQYLIMLAGAMEIGTADGSKLRLDPGDVLVAEDLTGHGHTGRGVGTEERVSLAAPLPAE